MNIFNKSSPSEVIGVSDRQFFGAPCVGSRAFIVQNRTNNPFMKFIKQ